MKTSIWALIIMVVLAGMGWQELQAQEYPTKSIRLIVPGPAAGGADVVARAVGARISEMVGQQVVVDNRPGANGQIATEITAKSMPDGYTVILATSSALALNPNLGPVPYDPVNSFTPIAMVATSQLLLVVHPSLPVKTVSDVIRLAKARPGQLLYASNGLGSLSHLTTELFRSQAGIEIVHVPYKGGTPAVTDTVSGQTSLIITALPTLMTQVRAGRVRPVAVTGLKRTAVLPDIPTIAESGLTGFSSAQWYGMFAPAGTATGVVQRLNTASVKAVSSSEVKEVLAREGLEGAAGSPRDLAVFLVADLAKWAKVVKAAGMQRT